mgnify:CR=1 FL=1
MIFAGKFLGYHLNICRIIAAVFLIAMCGDWDTKIYLFFFSGISLDRDYMGMWLAAETQHLGNSLSLCFFFGCLKQIQVMLVKQCHKPAPSHHHVHRWYVYHSQSWVVYCFPTLMEYEVEMMLKFMVMGWDVRIESSGIEKEYHWWFNGMYIIHVFSMYLNLLWFGFV